MRILPLFFFIPVGYLKVLLFFIPFGSIYLLKKFSYLGQLPWYQYDIRMVLTQIISQVYRNSLIVVIPTEYLYLTDIKF